MAVRIDFDVQAFQISLARHTQLENGFCWVDVRGNQDYPHAASSVYKNASIAWVYAQIGKTMKQLLEWTLTCCHRPAVACGRDRRFSSDTGKWFLSGKKDPGLGYQTSAKATGMQGCWSFGDQRTCGKEHERRSPETRGGGCQGDSNCGQQANDRQIKGEHCELQVARLWTSFSLSL